LGSGRELCEDEGGGAWKPNCIKLKMSKEEE